MKNLTAWESQADYLEMVAFELVLKGWVKFYQEE